MILSGPHPIIKPVNGESASEAGDKLLVVKRVLFDAKIREGHDYIFGYLF
jgi:hypothetical protein